MKDSLLVAGIGFLILFSLLILRSIAPFLFPSYFVYIVLALVAFFVFCTVGEDEKDACGKRGADDVPY